MEFPVAHFPLNAWYAAAYDVELKRVLLPRTICNRKMVLYRLQDGSPAALEDACWHRLLPLSHRDASRATRLSAAIMASCSTGDGRCLDRCLRRRR